MTISQSLYERLLKNRGVKADDLFLTSNTMPSPYALKGMDEAVDLIDEAINNDRFILIVADFDCDGATACATMIRGLTLLGCSPRNIAFVVPNRVTQGYGLTPALVERIADKEIGWQPDLVITVDNGISSHAGIEALKAAFPKTKIVVTDHHLQGEGDLPHADAIVNPNQAGCTFPSKHIAGVGVAFFTLLALEQKRKPEVKTIASLLPIVALGTICDVVSLDALNRTIVKHGLTMIRQGKAPAGIKALLFVAGRNPKTMASEDCGFALGPRINACGRMTDMTKGILLLLEDNYDDALELAKEIDETNVQRKKVEKDMQAQANELLAYISFDNTPDAVCLYDERWHQGVIGLLAGRIKERLYRPTIIFAKGDNGQIKASCRSIPGIHIRDVLAEIFEQDDVLGCRYGGHAFAAGLTIEEKHFMLFKTRLDRIMARYDKAVFKSNPVHDGALSAKELTVKTAESLPTLLPWGKDFEPPVFENTFNVIDSKMVGSDKDCVSLTIEHNAMQFKGIAFKQGFPAALKENGKGQVTCLYRPSVNEWMGKKSMQIIIERFVC